jgi:hypothetical protein
MRLHFMESMDYSQIPFGFRDITLVTFRPGPPAKIEVV